MCSLTTTEVCLMQGSCPHVASTVLILRQAWLCKQDTIWVWTVLSDVAFYFGVPGRGGLEYQGEGGWSTMERGT